MTPAEALEALAVELEERIDGCVTLARLSGTRSHERTRQAARAGVYTEAARLARTRAAELRQEEPVEVNLDHEPVREAARQSVVLDEVTP